MATKSTISTNSVVGQGSGQQPTSATSKKTTTTITAATAVRKKVQAPTPAQAGTTGKRKAMMNNSKEKRRKVEAAESRRSGNVSGLRVTIAGKMNKQQPEVPPRRGSHSRQDDRQTQQAGSSSRGSAHQGTRSHRAGGARRGRRHSSGYQTSWHDPPEEVGELSDVSPDEDWTYGDEEKWREVEGWGEEEEENVTPRLSDSDELEEHEGMKHEHEGRNHRIVREVWEEEEVGNEWWGEPGNESPPQHYYEDEGRRRSSPHFPNVDQETRDSWMQRVVNYMTHRGDEEDEEYEQEEPGPSSWQGPSRRQHGGGRYIGGRGRGRHPWQLPQRPILSQRLTKACFNILRAALSSRGGEGQEEEEVEEYEEYEGSPPPRMRRAGNFSPDSESAQSGFDRYDRSLNRYRQRSRSHSQDQWGHSSPTHYRHDYPRHHHSPDLSPRHRGRSRSSSHHRSHSPSRHHSRSPSRHHSHSPSRHHSRDRSPRPHHHLRYSRKRRHSHSSREDLQHSLSSDDSCDARYKQRSDLGHSRIRGESRRGEQNSPSCSSHHPQQRLPYTHRPGSNTPLKDEDGQISAAFKRSLETIRKQCLREEDPKLREVLVALWKVHKNECHQYMQCPEAYPDYMKEYRLFAQRKHESIMQVGGDPYTYDYHQEWKTFWPRRMTELFEQGWEEKRQCCLSVLLEKERKRIFSRSHREEQVARKGRDGGGDVDSTRDSVVQGDAMLGSSRQQTPQQNKEQEINTQLADILKILNHMKVRFGEYADSLHQIFLKAEELKKTKQNSDTLLYDVETFTTLKHINEKMKNTLKDESLTIIQKVIIEEAFERFRVFMTLGEERHSFLMGLDVWAVARETLDMDPPSTLAHIAEALEKRGHTCVPHEKVTDIYVEVKEAQERLQETISIKNEETQAGAADCKENVKETTMDTDTNMPLPPTAEERNDSSLQSSEQLHISKIENQNETKSSVPGPSKMVKKQEKCQIQSVTPRSRSTKCYTASSVNHSSLVHITGKRKGSTALSRVIVQTTSIPTSPSSVTPSQAMEVVPVVPVQNGSNNATTGTKEARGRVCLVEVQLSKEEHNKKAVSHPSQSPATTEEAVLYPPGEEPSMLPQKTEKSEEQDLRDDANTNQTDQDATQENNCSVNPTAVLTPQNSVKVNQSENKNDQQEANNILTNQGNNSSDQSESRTNQDDVINDPPKSQAESTNPKENRLNQEENHTIEVASSTCQAETVSLPAEEKKILQHTREVPALTPSSEHPATPTQQQTQNGHVSESEEAPELQIDTARSKSEDVHDDEVSKTGSASEAPEESDLAVLPFTMEDQPVEPVSDRVEEHIAKCLFEDVAEETMKSVSTEVENETVESMSIAVEENSTLPEPEKLSPLLPSNSLGNTIKDCLYDNPELLLVADEAESAHSENPINLDFDYTASGTLDSSLIEALMNPKLPKEETKVDLPADTKKPKGPIKITIPQFSKKPQPIMHPVPDDQELI